MTSSIYQIVPYEIACFCSSKQYIYETVIFIRSKYEVRFDPNAGITASRASNSRSIFSKTTVNDETKSDNRLVKHLSFVKRCENAPFTNQHIDAFDICLGFSLAFTAGYNSIQKWTRTVSKLLILRQMARNSLFQFSLLYVPLPLSIYLCIFVGFRSHFESNTESPLIES